MEKIKLGDIADIYLGLTHTPKYVEKGVPFLSVKDISNGKIDFSKCHYITEEEFNTLPAGAKPQVGDMLFCRVGTIGKPIIIKEGTIKFGSFVSLGFLRITKKDYLLDYVKYWMLSNDFFQQVSKNVKGVAQINLNTSWLKKFELPQLEIKEQKKLIKKLDKIQEIIDFRKKQIEELDELIKSQFAEMFGNPVLNEKNWIKKKLAEECNIITGNTPSRNVKEYYGNYIEWIKSDNIDMLNKFVTKAEEYLSEKGLKVGRSIESDSILMTCIAGSIKCIGNVSMTDRKVTFNQQINGIETLENNTYFMYIQFKLSQQYIQSSINMSLKGILSKGKLSEMKFIFPPIELQNQFAELAEKIDKQKFFIEKSLKETEELQESLMNKYFG